MDQLRSLFQASLATEPATRHQAEAALGALQASPGFLSTLFSLVASQDQPLPARQAAAIYLKNFARASYDGQTSLAKTVANQPKISEHDRAFLKQHILHALASVPSSISTLLLPTLAVIISSDYPERWPDLLPQTVNLLGSNDFPLVQAGLLTLLEIMRLYRWSGRDKSQLRSDAISLSFPILLQLSQSLISNPPENYALLPTPASLDHANSNIGSLLYLALKIYKTSITAELPIFQQQQIIPWGQLFLAVIRKTLKNSPGFPGDPDEQDRWGWSKAKKWAYFILNRLYSRYGSPSQLPSNMLQYRPFAENFISSFAGPILRLYLEQVELFIQEHDWMSRKVICHTIIFFEECIRPKETWSVLKPQVSVLLSHFIFPLLCITEEEISEFENQPEDYVRSQFAEFFEDICSNPSTISAGFLLALASGRKKTMFMSLLSFITDVCAKYPTGHTPRDKDGALRSLAHLATVITETKSIRPNIEEFFSAYVFPEFRSEHAFLRARTCEVVRKFEIAGSEWSKQELLNTAYQGVTQCLSDPSLPVRVQAALTLPELCEHPQVHEGVAPHIGQIMKGLLALSNEVDLDSLTQATRSLVSKFSDELLPFAADMAQALHQSYMRLMSEIAEARRQSGDEDDDSSEEKVLVAMNILKTLQQLVVGLEGNPNVLYQVEAASIPLIKYTLKEEIVEIYDEALELLDSTQFALKTITNEQWELFDIIYDVFKTSGADFVAEMFPALDNYLSYGGSYISSHPDTLNKMLDIYLSTMTSKTASCSDRIIACKLADSVLLCLRGHADGAVPMFLEHTMRIIQQGITTIDPITTKALLMHALEVVLNAIYYNPGLSMDVLIKNGWSSEFFGEWFSRLTSFKRTHDKKLGLLAISAILSISINEGVDNILAQSSGQLVLGALTLFETLPDAIRTRFELEKRYNLDSEDGSDLCSHGSDEDENGENDDEDVIDQPEEIYRGHLTSSRTKTHANPADDVTIPPSSLWSDEILWETPLDRLDAYCEFAAVMKNIETSGHPVLNIITNSLSTEQRDGLQKILKQASEGGEQIMKGHIQEAVQASRSWAQEIS
ncbi:hypothetical protein PTTG_03903 [Puccinia triticina 1-1 BBBD Race 1]|uniref:Importin N-terminal domain-containing protein n=1 Tax=Puccinia triticina (isolate 1-1 / race 1 (BBBD)) TaxID=630390 RepID=A0A180GRS6_PUCT1|nr:hypothetical protein PTTG_03903 [Puccinia triticina 1-1 BBBD Race 1]